MTKEVGRLLLIIVSWANETYAAVLPDNLALSMNYLYEFLLGVGSWIGYATAAGYFFSEEFGLGDVVCETSGYGYEVIDGLQVLVTFTEENPAEDETTTS